MRRRVRARLNEFVYECAGRITGDRAAYYRFDNCRDVFIVRLVWVRQGPVRFFTQPQWYPIEQIKTEFDPHVRQIDGYRFEGQRMPPINFIEDPAAIAQALKDGVLYRVG